MALDSNNEKLQEISIIVMDRIRSVDRRWWYALGLSFVVCIPLYFVARSFFATVTISNHHFPAYIYEDEAKVPLSIGDKKIFKLGQNSYSAYFKIKNSSNFDWGVPEQTYTVTLSTTAGKEIAKIQKTTYVLPSSEKIIIVPRFTSDSEPTMMDVALGPTQFVRRSTKPSANLELSRINLNQSQGTLVVTAQVKNNTPFTISQVGLPTLLYDSNNNVVGANYTNIDDLAYAESRSFQLTWSGNPDAVRAEILPEVNTYDSNIYTLPPGTSQFDTTPK